MSEAMKSSPKRAPMMGHMVVTAVAVSFHFKLTENLEKNIYIFYFKLNTRTDTVRTDC